MTSLPDHNDAPGAQPLDVAQALAAHRRWLTTVLRARGVEADAVEELMQEVHLAAVRGAEQLREPEKVAPWLYRIAVVTALQYRRRRGRQRKLVERYIHERETDYSRGESDPLDWLLADEQRQLVRRAIEQLPARDAEMLLLKYTEHWSYQQLAEHLGISQSAVEARLHRAREKMRRRLARLSPESIPQ